MQIVLQSKNIARVCVAMMFVIGASTSWANYNQTSDINETYGLLNKILKKNESTIASFNNRYGNSSRCNNVKSCGTVSFTNTAVGRYRVDMSKAGRANQDLNFQVMAVGDNSVRCKVGSSGNVGDHFSYTGYLSISFNVLCHDYRGRPANSRFLVSTVGHGSRNGDHLHASANVHKSGGSSRLNHGFMNTGDYRNSYYEVETKRDQKGIYRIKLPGWRATDVNSVRLTAYDDNSNFCTVLPDIQERTGTGYRGQGFEAHVRVTCFNQKGDFSDTGFSLLVEKSYKGPTGRGVQKTIAKKTKGAWTDWDFKGTGAKLSLADTNSTIMLAHKNYSSRISFPFVTSLMKRKYCKIGSYKTRTVNSVPLLDVKVRCYELNKGLASSVLSWNFSSNLVSIN
ncbi:MAG: hypothetical protein K6L75_02595 [Cellvibrionaceae bacterium]